MAPVYDFRHVELDKIGRGKRIVKPPGGECSDIFGVQNGASPRVELMVTPRKGKNYMQSNIFSPDSPDSGYQNGHQHTPSPQKSLDTQNRLFGPDGDSTPRKVVNRQRSSIFDEDAMDSRPPSVKSTPIRKNMINPITGAPITENGMSNGMSNGSTPNGSTPNGSTNGYSNGISNGHSSPESPMNGMNGHARVRNPPGGRSSGIF
ncbi:microtubule-associated protein Jupiter-like [Uloborus diversus]|uniref:microtubule-associated protein Jupiter-like n=1 Tax=Uloborus diversus TaxID=327109 RepID=UPI0024092844|nr:microtubule-associated protein Jupiter-like [Uloborus diversus]